MIQPQFADEQNGDWKMPQTNAYVSYFPDRAQIIADRKDRGRMCSSAQASKLDFLPIEQSGQGFNFKTYDIVCIAKRKEDVIGGFCIRDRNPTRTFDGYPRFPTPEEWRMRFDFIGVCMHGAPFDQAGGVDHGIDNAIRGSIYNYVNNTGETLGPKQKMTWRPDLPEFDEGNEIGPKRTRQSGPDCVTGIFVKWEAPARNQHPWDLWPSLYKITQEWTREKTKWERDNLGKKFATQPEFADALLETFDGTTMAERVEAASEAVVEMWEKRKAGIEDVVAENAEWTDPGEVGRAVLV